jgi:hypothetical protein
MRTQLFLLLAATVCLPLAIGCSQTSQVVRGQGPEAYMADGAICYPDDCDDDDCDDDKCHRCRFCKGCGCCYCRPYCIPNDLVYPPPGDLPAIVQYPYYTNKGPDCFFHPPLR